MTAKGKFMDDGVGLIIDGYKVGTDELPAAWTEPAAQDLTESGMVILAAGEDPEAITDEVAPAPASNHWAGVLAVEGSETGDGREFAPNSIVWDEANLPLPLLWQREGAEGHDGQVLVGDILSVWRDGPLIRATGTFDDDLESEYGREALRQVTRKLLRGVSVDIDSIKDADIELVFPGEKASYETEAEEPEAEEPAPEEPEEDPDTEVIQEEDAPLDLLQTPDKVVFHKGRLRGATLTPLPAFVEAFIEIVDAPVEEEPAEVALVAGGGPAVPPAEWFANPNLQGPTPLTITDEGQVFGHIATWGVCHTSVQNVCTQAPHEELHAYFLTGEVACANGERVPVGQLTFGTGHASTQMAGARPATEHYDNTGHAGADVTSGNDEFGIWCAGALRPELTDSQVREMRAAVPSGDWRRISGKLRMVAALMVNVPGFPVARARLVEGDQVSLVAAGVLPRAVEPAKLAPGKINQAALERVSAVAAQHRQARLARAQELSMLVHKEKE